jgi:hypothetical protein
MVPPRAPFFAAISAHVSEPARAKPAPAAAQRDGEGRNRTGDTTVFSRVLYQLSYLARRRQCSRGAECLYATRSE